MRQRVPELDLARSLAIVAVVVIHATSTALEPFEHRLAGEPLVWALLLLNQAARFAVPLFLLVSGCALALTQSEEQSYGRWLWRRLSRIVPAYVLWSFLYLAWTKHLAPLPAARALILGSAFGHLYFVPLIIQCYVLFPPLRRVFASDLGAAACMLVTACTLALRHVSGAGPLKLLANQRSVLGWIGYFALGAWFAGRLPGPDSATPRARGLLTAALVLAAVGVGLETGYLMSRGWPYRAAGANMRPTVLVFSLIVWAWIWSRTWRLGRLAGSVKWLSAASYGIYLSHCLVIQVGEGLCRRAGLDLRSPVFSIALLVFAFGGCLAIAAVGQALGPPLQSLVSWLRPKAGRGRG